MFVQIKRRQAANRKIKKRSEQFTEYDGKKKKKCSLASAREMQNSKMIRRHAFPSQSNKMTGFALLRRSCCSVMSSNTGDPPLLLLWVGVAPAAAWTSSWRRGIPREGTAPNLCHVGRGEGSRTPPVLLTVPHLLGHLALRKCLPIFLKKHFKSYTGAHFTHLQNQLTDLCYIGKTWVKSNSHVLVQE